MSYQVTATISVLIALGSAGLFAYYILSSAGRSRGRKGRLNVDEFFSSLLDGKTITKALYEAGSQEIRSTLLSGSLPGIDAGILDVNGLVASMLVEEYRTDPVLASRYVNVLREAAEDLEVVRQRFSSVLRAIQLRTLFVLFVSGVSLHVSVLLSSIIAGRLGSTFPAQLYSLASLMALYYLALKTMPASSKTWALIASTILLGYAAGGLIAARALSIVGARPLFLGGI